MDYFDAPWKTKRLWLPHQLFNLIGTAGADTGQSAGAPVVAVQAGAGELSVVQMGADLDELATIIPIPWDLDRTKKVLARILWVHSSTDADAVVWGLLTKFHAKLATVVDMATSPDVTTAFASHTCSTTNESLEATVWTDLTWEGLITEADLMVSLQIICTTIAASANENELLGLELMYQIDPFRILKGSTASDLLTNPV